MHHPLDFRRRPKKQSSLATSSATHLAASFAQPSDVPARLVFITDPSGRNHPGFRHCSHQLAEPLQHSVFRLRNPVLRGLSIFVLANSVDQLRRRSYKRIAIPHLYKQHSAIFAVDRVALLCCRVESVWGHAQFFDVLWSNACRLRFVFNVHLHADSTIDFCQRCIVLVGQFSQSASEWCPRQSTPSVVDDTHLIALCRLHFSELIWIGDVVCSEYVDCRFRRGERVHATVPVTIILGDVRARIRITAICRLQAEVVLQLILCRWGFQFVLSLVEPARLLEVLKHARNIADLGLEPLVVVLVETTTLLAQLLGEALDHLRCPVLLLRVTNCAGEERRVPLIRVHVLTNRGDRIASVLDIPTLFTGSGDCTFHHPRRTFSKRFDEGARDEDFPIFSQLLAEVVLDPCEQLCTQSICLVGTVVEVGAVALTFVLQPSLGQRVELLTFLSELLAKFVALGFNLCAIHRSFVTHLLGLVEGEAKRIEFGLQRVVIKADKRVRQLAPSVVHKVLRRGDKFFIRFRNVPVNRA